MPIEIFIDIAHRFDFFVQNKLKIKKKSVAVKCDLKYTRQKSCTTKGDRYLHRQEVNLDSIILNLEVFLENQLFKIGITCSTIYICQQCAICS